MSASGSSDIEEVLDQLRNWSASDRIRLARRILESVEGGASGGPARARSPRDLLGLLRTAGPPPGDDECQAILDEELIRKHLR